MQYMELTKDLYAEKQLKKVIAKATQYIVLNTQFTEAIPMHHWHRKRCSTSGFKERNMKPQGHGPAYLPNGENMEQLEVNVGMIALGSSLSVPYNDKYLPDM